MSHGIGLDSETRFHLDPDNNDEYLGDTQDWYPQGTILVNPENDMVEAIEAGPLTTFDEYIEAMERHEFNTPVDSDITPVETIPVIDIAKEDMHMSRPDPKKTTPSNHRLVISNTESGYTDAQGNSIELFKCHPELEQFVVRQELDLKAVIKKLKEMQKLISTDKLDANHPIYIAFLAAQDVFAKLKSPNWRRDTITPREWIEKLNDGPNMRFVTFDHLTELLKNATGDRADRLQEIRNKLRRGRHSASVKVHNRLLKSA
jgi:hypothetical protein